MFRDGDGRVALRRQGDLDPQAGGLPLLRAGSTLGRLKRRRSTRSSSSSPRPRPRRCSPSSSSSSATGRRFNIRLRDDKSYPYIGISLDEEFPRVYFTRERHRPNRAYFGPFSNAKRVRETLDLLGKLFQYRTCEGPEPGRRSGVPCLDYYIKRCGAPCVGYIDREEYRRNIDAIVRLPLRPLPRGRARPGGEDGRGRRPAQDFERAALFRDRLPSVTVADGAPAGRRRAASGPPT